MLVLYIMRALRAMKYHQDNLKTDFKEHLRSQKLSDATIRYYVSDVRVFLRFIYQISGDYEISPEMFESYENFLKSGTLPNKTINRKLSSLRIFSSFLLQKGLLKENIMKKVKNNKNGKSPRQFKFSTTAILLVIFLIIVAVGGFIISTTRKDFFFISNSFTPNPVTISHSIQADIVHPPELLNSQNIQDISVEGGTPDMPVTIVSFGKDTISEGEVVSKVAVPLHVGSDSIFLTPLSQIEGSYYVEEQKDYFLIHLSTPQKVDSSFNWLILSNQLPVDKLPR